MTRKRMFLWYQLKRKLKTQKMVQDYPASPWKEKKFGLELQRNDRISLKTVHLSWLCFLCFVSKLKDGRKSRPQMMANGIPHQDSDFQKSEQSELASLSLITLATLTTP